MVSPSTIFALSSAPGRAAVSVFRISGPGAEQALRLMAGKLPEPRRAAFASIRHPATGEKLDQALILFFKAPHSETGEDVAEIQAHGGKAVTASILAALGTLPGFRMAEPGEFARRAFAHGKLDLTTAEGIADLVDAETEAQRCQALAQASGALGKLYEGWRARLIEATAYVEAAIDFSDEADVSDKAVSDAEAVARGLEAELAAHLDDGNRGEILRDGFRIVLAGPPNVGKSSLLNALARRDAAIVSEEAGTTRDVIEVRLDLGGLPVILTDTAGLREAAGAIEREGIRRTLGRAREADLVLWLMDASAPDTHLPPEIVPLADRTLMVLNKVDLEGGGRENIPLPPRGGWQAGGAGRPPAGGIAPTPRVKPGAVSDPSPQGGEESRRIEAVPMPDDIVPVSARTGEGISALTERLAAIASDRIAGAGNDAPVITQTRHRQQVERALRALRAFLSGVPPDLEIRAEELRAAATALGRITGRIDVEDVLDQIFGRFCIGK